MLCGYLALVDEEREAHAKNAKYSYERKNNTERSRRLQKSRERTILRGRHGHATKKKDEVRKASSKQLWQYGIA